MQFWWKLKISIPLLTIIIVCILAHYVKDFAPVHFFPPKFQIVFFSVTGYMDSRLFFLQSSWIEKAQLKSSDPQLINSDLLIY